VAPQVEAVQRGREAFEAYYTAQGLCGHEDWQRCMDLLRAPLPPAFRLQSSTGAVGAEAASLLRGLEAWQPEPVPWCPGAYRLRGSGALAAGGQCDAALNKSLLALQRGASVSRQESASMLPVLALRVEPQHRVLELCAAPGSKTMQLLDALATESGAIPPGLLAVNDLKLARLQLLLGRVRRVPTEPLLAVCSDARAFPGLTWAAGHGKKAAVRFDRVLCDVPCSGDGTVRKAPSLLGTWTPRAGLAHHGDQLGILKRGLELLAPGGLLAYSTCALNPVECEAVVGAALAEADGAFETVPVDVPGLRFAPGLAAWKVPAANAEMAAAAWAGEGGLIKSWEDIPIEERSSCRLRRSMFPPGAYARSPADAAQLEGQLRRCARLLPCHDDGGCFFLALLRRRAEARPPLRRGDPVFVKSQGREAVVREPRARGPYAGLIRIAYSDGSHYHVMPDELERPDGTGEGARPVEQLKMWPPAVVPVSDDLWEAVSGFYGLLSDPAEAAAAGVRAFPRGALVCTPDGASSEDPQAPAALSLASTALCALAHVPGMRAAGRLALVRMAGPGPVGESEEPWPVEAFGWRPALTAALPLAAFCSRRVLRSPSVEALRSLLHDGAVPEAALGVGSSPEWPPGPLFLVARAGEGGAPEVVYVGLLGAGRVRLVTQKGVRLNYASLGLPVRWQPGSNFRCGADVRSRWLPASRRVARA